MKAVAQEVARKALELDEHDRAELAALLLDSLEEQAGEETDAAWIAEIERRGAEMESGAVQGVPWEEVRDRLRRGGVGS